MNDPQLGAVMVDVPFVSITKEGSSSSCVMKVRNVARGHVSLVVSDTI